MEERLPDMEHTVNNTRVSLEKGLRNELGKKMTPWVLQENADRQDHNEFGDAIVAHVAWPFGHALVRTLQTVLSTGRNVR